MRSIAATLVAGCLVANTVHGGFVADGDLSEWGTVVDGKNLTGTGNGFTFTYSHEDQDLHDKQGDNGFLGPNKGGQNYDVEFLGVTVLDGKLIVAIQTGQRADNGMKRFSPGDLRIETTDGNVFGVEIGGGKGGAGHTQVGLGDNGSTYKLDKNGFTKKHTGDSENVAGSVWKNADWIDDPIKHGTPDSMGDFSGYQEVQLDLGTGTYVGMVAEYIYNFDPSLGPHAVIELSIPLSFFEGATIDLVQWAPSCGNDVLQVNPLIDTDISEVPEPASLVLALLGTIGIGASRRARRKEAA